MSVGHSDVKGGISGASNIDADPQFVSASGGDLRLQSGSPGIDGGLYDVSLSDSPTDLEGKPRIAGGSVDMGAFESQADISALIRKLKADVTALVKGGAALPANGNSLQVKLDAALSAMMSGDNATAIDRLQDFLNQVRAFVKTGRLTPAQGAMLSSTAKAAISQLGG